jgi:hypothetical protein
MHRDQFRLESQHVKTCFTSVASIRLVKTVNPISCVKLNCKLLKSARALYCM